MHSRLSPRDRAIIKFGSAHRAAIDSDAGIIVAEAMWKLGSEMAKEANIGRLLRGAGAWLKGTARAAVSPGFRKHWSAVRKAKKFVGSGGAASQAATRAKVLERTQGIPREIAQAGLAGERIAPSVAGGMPGRIHGQYEIASAMRRGEVLAEKEIKRGLGAGIPAGDLMRSLSKRTDLEGTASRLGRVGNRLSATDKAALMGREKTLHSNLGEFAVEPKTVGTRFEEMMGKGREFAKKHPVVTGVGGLYAAKQMDII